MTRGGRRRAAELFERALAVLSLAVVLPVVVLAVAALAAFVYGTAVLVNTVVEMVNHPFPVGHKVGLLISVVDLFLVGTTLLIAAVGLYELFVTPGGDRPTGPSHVPSWLVMHDLNDLKVRVVGMIVLVVAVAFAQAVVEFLPGAAVAELGAGVAAVTLALTAFIRFGHSRSGGEE